ELGAVDADENLVREALPAQRGLDAGDAGTEIALALRHERVRGGGVAEPVDVAVHRVREPCGPRPRGQILERACREAPGGLGRRGIAEHRNEAALRALRSEERRGGKAVSSWWKA